MVLACILNHALAPHLKDELVAAMKSESFSLSVDASIDSGLSKMNPLTVKKTCAKNIFIFV